METTLDSMIDKAVATMLELPEQKLETTGLLTSCIVNSVHSFSKVNKLALAQRGKAFTEAKREEVGAELSKILFYSSCAVHLLNLDKDKFDSEAVQIFSEQFTEGYQEDVILCSLHGMQQFIDLSEMLFNPIDDTDFLDSEGEAGDEVDQEITFPGELPELTPEVLVGTAQSSEAEETTEVSETEETGIDDGPEFLAEIDDQEATEIVASIFACVYLLCQRLALDYETIVYNVTTIEKFV